jgi:hypothetical protein
MQLGISKFYGYTLGMFVALLAVAAAPAYAQQACTYDDCALRLEQNEVIAGKAGKKVGSLGFMSFTDLTQTFSASDSAAAQYAVFRDYYNTGSLLSGLTGTTLTGVWIFRDKLSTGYEIGIIISALVLGAVGNHHAKRAEQSLARAIWWYNRDLPR